MTLLERLKTHQIRKAFGVSRRWMPTWVRSSGKHSRLIQSCFSMLFGWLDSRISMDISIFFWEHLHKIDQNRLSRSFAYFSTRLPLALDLEHFAMTALETVDVGLTEICSFYNPPRHFLHRMGGAGALITPPFCGKWFLKMGSSLQFCSNLWVLAGFIIFFWRHDHLWAPRQTIFVTNQKRCCRGF